MRLNLKPSLLSLHLLAWTALDRGEPDEEKKLMKSGTELILSPILGRKDSSSNQDGLFFKQHSVKQLRYGTRTFSYFFWNSKLMNLSNSSSSWTYFFLSSVSFTGTRDIKFISYFPWPDMTGSGTTEWNPSRNPICPDLFLYDRTDPILLKEVI